MSLQTGWNSWGMWLLLGLSTASLTTAAMGQRSASPLGGQSTSGPATPQKPTNPVPGPTQAPDLSVTNQCTVPGMSSVICRVTIQNVGQLASASPLKIVGQVSGTYTGGLTGGQGGDIQPQSCTGTQGGPIQNRTCTFNVSLQPGESKFFFFGYGFTQGNVTHCATVTAGGNTVRDDSHPANNTNICSSVTVAAAPVSAPDLSVTNQCTVPGMSSVICRVTIQNVGQLASVSPLKIVAQVSGSYAGGQTGGQGGDIQPQSCTGAQGGPIQNRTCTFNVSLQPGESKFFFFGYGFPHGNITHCATVTTASSNTVPDDSHPANNTNICSSATVQ